MFTGIIETTAQVLRKTATDIRIARPEEFLELSIGQSIAVNGACLSVMEITKEAISFDVIPESFARTNLGTAEIVNLERALPANGRFEGHIVSGHVDGTVALLRREKEGTGERFFFAIPTALRNFMVEKGSITLNGIALTIANISVDNFSVALIPHTLLTTNLGILRAGDMVNVEADMLAKYWYQWFQERKVA